MKKTLLIVSFILLKSNVHASAPGIVLNGYAAKDYCSCRFVSQLSHKECKKRIGVGFSLPHGKIRVDEEKKVVVVGRNNPENVRVAYFIDERLGCRLLAPEL